MGAVLLAMRCTLVIVCIGQCDQMNRKFEGMDAKKSMIKFNFAPSDGGVNGIVCALEKGHFVICN